MNRSSNIRFSAIFTSNENNNAWENEMDWFFERITLTQKYVCCVVCTMNGEIVNPCTNRRTSRKQNKTKQTKKKIRRENTSLYICILCLSLSISVHNKMDKCLCFCLPFLFGALNHNKSYKIHINEYSIYFITII